VDFDLEQAMRDHPLPDGIEDAALNLKQLSIAMGVSTTTLDKWRDQGLPVVSSGQNGREYVFQLSECYAWRQHRDAQFRARREAADRSAQQMALLFRNDGEADPEGPVLTARDIEEEARADYQRQRAAEMRGELVRTARVREVMEDLLVQFRTTLETLPDFAERQFGLNPAQVHEMQTRCDSAIVDTRRRIEALLAERTAATPVTLRPQQGDLGV
jgi:phage terminase Nu1 subunit (DNA packaging protein)